jgi:hypothetical protein
MPFLTLQCNRSHSTVSPEQCLPCHCLGIKHRICLRPHAAGDAPFPIHVQVPPYAPYWAGPTASALTCAQDLANTCGSVYHATMGAKTGPAAHKWARNLGEGCPAGAAAVLVFLHTMHSMCASAPHGGFSRGWEDAVTAVERTACPHLWPLRPPQWGEAGSSASVPVARTHGVKRIAPTELALASGSADTVAGTPLMPCPAADALPCSSRPLRKRSRTGPASATALSSWQPLAVAQPLPAWHHACLLLLVADSTGEGGWGSRADAQLRRVTAAPAALPLALAVALARLGEVLHRHRNGAGDDGAVEGNHPLCTLAHLALSVPLTKLQPGAAELEPLCLPSTCALHLDLTTVPFHSAVTRSAAASIQLMCLSHRLGHIGLGARSLPLWTRDIFPASLRHLARAHLASRALFSGTAATRAPLVTQAVCIAHVCSRLDAAVRETAAAVSAAALDSADDEAAMAPPGSTAALALACIACMHACPLLSALMGKLGNEIAAIQMPPPAFTPSLRQKSLSGEGTLVDAPQASSASSHPHGGRPSPSACTPPLLVDTPAARMPPPVAATKQMLSPDMMHAQRHFSAAEGHVASCIASLGVRPVEYDTEHSDCGTVYTQHGAHEPPTAA